MTEWACSPPPSILWNWRTLWLKWHKYVKVDVGYDDGGRPIVITDGGACVLGEWLTPMNEIPVDY